MNPRAKAVAILPAPKKPIVRLAGMRRIVEGRWARVERYSHPGVSTGSIFPNSRTSPKLFECPIRYPTNLQRARGRTDNGCWRLDVRRWMLIIRDVIQSGRESGTDLC